MKTKEKDEQMQEEMVGVLTAISIVSKSLANRLLQLDRENNEGGEKDEQSKMRTGCSK